MLHDKPNSAMPANRFWSTVTAHLLLWGNAFIPLDRSPQSGLVEELRLADPASMNVEWNQDTLVKSFYVDTIEGRKRWSDEDMLHIVAWSLDGIIGQSRIGWCRNMLGAAIARDKFEGGFWDRGATFSGVIEHPDVLGPEGLANLAMGFNAKYAGAAEQGHQTPILEEGATFRPLSMPLADMQFVENAQLSRTDIAVLFNLPPAYLGGSTGDSLTYATVESNQIQFVQHAVMPYTDTIAKAVTSDPGIFPQNVYFAEFVTEALLKADKVTQATYYEKLFALIDGEGRRVLGTDEIRARENMPPAIKEKTPEPPPVAVPPDLQANADALAAANGKTNGKADQLQLPVPSPN
jgi:HK97 family phage portal protein